MNPFRYCLERRLDMVGAATQSADTSSEQRLRPLPGIFGFDVPSESDEPGSERFFRNRGFTFDRSAGFAGRAQAVVDQPLPGQIGQVGQIQAPEAVASAFTSPLEQALLRPEFGPTTASENALLDAIQSQTQGASALRGLGPAGAGAIAQNIAPALIGLRQQNIGNLQRAETANVGQLLQGRGQDIGFGLGQREQDITQREQDIGQRARSVQEQQQQFGNLLQLANLSLPRNLQQLISTSSSKGGSGSVLKR